MSEDRQEQKIQDLTIRIERNTCIGSGSCTKVAPEVFELDDDTVVMFREDQQPVDREELLEACRVCPVDALLAFDESGKQIVPEE